MAGPGRGLSRPAGSPITPPRRATINDVAAVAGVSRQTVTRAMNDMDGISPATKIKVREAARQLSYRPSRFGRGLVKAEHRTLGLVLHDLTNPYYPELASAVVGYAAKAGWNVLLADTIFVDHSDEIVAPLAQQVDAMVGYFDPANADILGGLPSVRLDPATKPSGGAVLLDFRPAMRAAVRRLVDAGVDAPVVLDVSNPDQPSGRAEFVITEFAAQGVTARVVRTAESTQAAAGTVGELIDADDAFDAVVGFNDTVALGALNACQRRGLAVPERIKIIGVDGLSMGTVVTPALTSVAIDLSEVARHAVELALGMHSGLLPRSGAKVRRTVKHTLVVRETA